jgi:hypothetical protein
MIVSSAAERLRGKHAQKCEPAALASKQVTRWQRVLILVTALLGTAGVAQAETQVQMSVDKEPGLCKHFRQALEADHVALKTRDQLCQYSFEQRHSNQGYFEKLDWQPMSGDPVALTLKIFDANVLPPNIQSPASVAKLRARLTAYARAQDAHHALIVEMAPYTRTQLTLPATFTPVTGYILRSRGTYCGPGHDETYSKRSELIAFFIDKGLTHSMPISGSLIDNTDEPIKIDEKYYVVNIFDAPMWSDWYPPGITGSYSLTLSELSNSDDNQQLYTSALCSYNYFRKIK